jgi:beta-propeller uncharacterized protein DUF5122
MESVRAIRCKRSMLALVAIATFVLIPTAASAKPGALDPGFGDSGRIVTQTDLGNRDWPVNIAEGPNGTIVAATEKTILRYLPDGSLDPSFGEGGKVTIPDPEGLPFSLRDLAVGTDGRVFLIGSVEIPDVWVPVTYISSAHPTLAAVIGYTSDGKLDPAYGGGKGFLVSEFGQSSPYPAGGPTAKL